MYVCGPTVYDNPHVGNARSLVVFDLLYRVLNKLYGKENVTYVRNITDVDDKIIEASKKRNVSIDQVTTEVTKIFHENTKALNCLTPSVEPKATEHIKEMIEMINSLIAKKLAYVNDGHVYFLISRFKKISLLVDFTNSKRSLRLGILAESNVFCFEKVLPYLLLESIPPTL